MAKILKLTYPNTSHTGIDRPLQEDSGNQQTFKISKFCNEAFVSIKECADVLTEYENLLTEMGNIRMPEFKVTREAYFNAEPLVLSPEFKTLTHFCVNLTL